MLKIKEIKKVYYYTTIEDGITTDFGLTMDEQEARGNGKEFGLASIADLNLFYEIEGIAYKDIYAHVVEGVYKCIETEDENGIYYTYKIVEQILDNLDEETQKIIMEVDDLFLELEMNEYINTLSIEEKLLFHANMLDFNNNRFCMKIEFDNLEQVSLLNFLANTDDLKKEFLERFYDPDEPYELFDQIWSFKKYSRNVLQRGQNITALELQQYIDRNDYVSLRTVLENLYLEPLAIRDMDHLQRYIRDGLSGGDIINWYKKNKGRFLTMFTFKVDYIKLEALRL